MYQYRGTQRWDPDRPVQRPRAAVRTVAPRPAETALGAMWCCGCDTDPTPSQRSTWEQFGRLALVRHDCPDHGSTTLARMRVEGGA